MGIISVSTAYGGKMIPLHGRLLSQDTKLTTWNPLFQHELVYCIPDPTASYPAAVIVTYQGPGAEDCRLDIEMLALAPANIDGKEAANALLIAVENKARILGKRTLVSLILIIPKPLLKVISSPL